MFKSARLQLTFWFVLIVMVISAFFSIIVFEAIDIHLIDSYRRAEVRINNRNFGPQLRDQNAMMGVSLPEIETIFSDEIDLARQFFINRLLFANGIILLGSGILSYILAGKALQPIEVAHQEQNRFIADASHELRTPLTILKTSLEVNLRDQAISQETKHLIRENLEEVNNLQRLTDRLLTFSVQENNCRLDGADELEPVNLKKTIKNAISEIQVLANKKQIAIHQKIDTVNVMGNATQLTQLFLIVLDNAVKYTPKTGSIHVKTKLTRKNVLISIKDTGIGIHQAEINHIFDRFYRADTARTKSSSPGVSQDGFGLGLSLAQQIVRQHGGEITVKSKVDHGSEFNIILPL